MYVYSFEGGKGINDVLYGYFVPFVRSVIFDGKQSLYSKSKNKNMLSRRIFPSFILFFVLIYLPFLAEKKSLTILTSLTLFALS
jgi:hypothetical protein